MIDSQKILVVFAMPEEEQGLFHPHGAPVLFTGLGKVNATYRLTHELQERIKRGNETRYVINFGTAGSSVYKTHDLVECVSFVQRDMDVSALGFSPGETPFESSAPMIRFSRCLVDLPSGICGTGDSFEISKPKVECDVLDMEAFALAKVCAFQGLPFASFKYITDGADHNAHNDWRQNLKFAGQRFSEIFQRLLKELPSEKES